MPSDDPCQVDGRPNERVRRVASSVLAAQGLAGSIWWAVLWSVDGAAELFSAPIDESPTIFRFALPDLALFVFGSAAAAALVWRRAGSGLVAASIVTGAAWYATLWCVSVAVWFGASWIGAALMLPVSIADAFVVALLQREEE